MAFRDVVRKLVKALRAAGAQYCVTGSLAVGYYGIPRSVKEIEVLVFPSWVAVKRTVSELRRRRFKMVDRLGKDLQDFRMEAKEGFRIRFVMANSERDLETLRRARTARFFGVGVRLASPEDLVIRSIARGGTKGFSDAAGILARLHDQLDRPYLQQRAEEAGIGEAFNKLVQKVW